MADSGDDSALQEEYIFEDAFAVLIAKERHDGQKTEHARTVLSCAASLLDVYMLMSLEGRPQDLRDACRRTTSLYAALSAEVMRQETLAWAMTPKFHLLAEMCEFQATSIGNPAKFWAHKDEDFVGWVATFAGSRDGANACAPSAVKMLSRFRARVREL